MMKKYVLKIGRIPPFVALRAHERFWNNLHQVTQNQKIGKPNNLIVLGAQNLWVLMLSVECEIKMTCPASFRFFREAHV